MVRGERFDLRDPHRTHAGRVNRTHFIIGALGKALGQIVQKSNHFIEDVHGLGSTTHHRRG